MQSNFRSSLTRFVVGAGWMGLLIINPQAENLRPELYLT